MQAVRIRGRSRGTIGFTLVELLVSITIIALLASLLFAVSRGALAKALDAKCISNLRALSVGMTSYAADWGYWPSQNRDTPTNPEVYGSQPWYYSLMVQNYIPTKAVKRGGYDCLVSDVLACPANKANPGYRYAWTSSPFPWTSSYAINQFWGDHYGTPLLIEGTIDRVRFPAGVSNPSAIMLVDSLQGSTMYVGNNADWNKASCTIPRNLHGYGAHALLANGSVISISPQSHPDLATLQNWDPRYTHP